MVQGHEGILNKDNVPQLNAIDDTEWDEEADKLYEWTQQLSYDDVTATPRFGTAMTASGVGSVL